MARPECKRLLYKDLATYKGLKKMSFLCLYLQIHLVWMLDFLALFWGPCCEDTQAEVGSCGKGVYCQTSETCLNECQGVWSAERCVYPEECIGSESACLECAGRWYIPTSNENSQKVLPDNFSTWSLYIIKSISKIATFRLWVTKISFIQ